MIGGAYGYALAVIAALLVAGGLYGKGRVDGANGVKAAQLEEYRAAVEAEAQARTDRARSDDLARRAADDFVRRVRTELTKVKEDFDGIPMVTINGDGCRDLSDGFRLRWNAAESAGDAGTAADGADGAVQSF